MKISKIEIKDFHQFKDLTIDLTYPKGHAKEGLPLDKVCFIGQSGTGKTSLLELIPKILCEYDTQFILKSGVDSLYDKIDASIVFGYQNEYSNNVRFSEPDESNEDVFWSHGFHKGKKSSFEKNYSFYSNTWIKKIATKLIYFPANLNYEIEAGGENTFVEKTIIDFSKEKI